MYVCVCLHVCICMCLHVPACVCPCVHVCCMFVCMCARVVCACVCVCIVRTSKEKHSTMEQLKTNDFRVFPQKLSKGS